MKTVLFLIAVSKEQRRRKKWSTKGGIPLKRAEEEVYISSGLFLFCSIYKTIFLLNYYLCWIQRRVVITKIKTKSSQQTDLALKIISKLHFHLDALREKFLRIYISPKILLLDLEEDCPVRYREHTKQHIVIISSRKHTFSYPKQQLLVSRC